jgi:hypothetical protein
MIALDVESDYMQTHSGAATHAPTCEGSCATIILAIR